MNRIRIIPRLDIKGPKLIKSINLEGLRVVGDPQEAALRYYEDGADELLYVDAVASLYERNSLHDIISQTVQSVFVPLTVGGGIRSVEDVRQALQAGADKVAINTAAIKSPSLLKECAEVFGSQCVVLSVEAKKIGEGSWEAYIDNGRERTGMDVVAWTKQATELGAGEILLTSVDREGTRLGYEVELVSAVTAGVNVPVIASGGMGKMEDMAEVCNIGGADAFAVADMLHYNRSTLSDIRGAAQSMGLSVRSL